MLPMVFAVAYKKCLEVFHKGNIETIMKGERKQETQMAGAGGSMNM